MLKTISKEEIKKKLSKHYPGETKHNMEIRELYEHKNVDDHEHVGSVFFSLTGSPPKGYAIYTPLLRKLSLYDAGGRRFRIIKNVRLEGFNDSQ